MAKWRQASRFAGDTLLLGDGPDRANFEWGPDGWRERPRGARISSLRLLQLVGDEHWHFILEAMLRAQMRSAQILVDRATALLLEREDIAEMTGCRAEIERIWGEVDEIAAVGLDRGQGRPTGISDRRHPA